MIAHDELYAIYAGCAGVVWFLGWWTRGPRARALDKAWDDGHAIGSRESYWDGYAIGVDDESRGLAYVYDENGDELQSSFKNVPRPGAGASGSLPDSGSSPETGPGQEVRPAGPSPAAGRTGGRYPDGREYPTAPGVVNAELAALAAESNAEPSEPISVHLDETTEQWTARMEMEAAIWCAENGVERERAGARS